MPTICNAPDGGLAATVDAEFTELVCSDEELLRMEFEAIIAAEWPTVPIRPPLRRQRGWPSRPAGNAAGRCPLGRVIGRPGHPGFGGWARERSPPVPASADEHPRPHSKDHGQAQFTSPTRR